MKPLVVLLILFGCTKAMSPANETQETATRSAPQPAPATNGPRVILPDGFVVSVEVVADDEMRAQGLMYRDHLEPSAGMLFLFPQDGEYPFWMKNTLIPLDMIWIDSNQRIAAVKQDVPPCRTTDCPSYPPNAMARYVLELAAGGARQHGLKVGDQLRFEGTAQVVPR